MDFDKLIEYAKEVLKPRRLSDCVEVGGVAAAIFFGYIISVIFNPKTKP